MSVLEKLGYQHSSHTLLPPSTLCSGTAQPPHIPNSSDTAGAQEAASSPAAHRQHSSASPAPPCPLHCYSPPSTMPNTTWNSPGKHTAQADTQQGCKARGSLRSESERAFYPAKENMTTQPSSFPPSSHHPGCPSFTASPLSRI